MNYTSWISSAAIKNDAARKEFEAKRDDPETRRKSAVAIERLRKLLKVDETVANKQKYLP